MSAPLNLPLTLYRGDTYRWSFVCWADSGRTVASDLTGVVARAEIRPTAGGTATLMTCAITDNAIAVTLASADGIPVSTIPTGVWDLELTYPSGDVRTIVAGKVTLRGDVTGGA